MCRRATAVLLLCVLAGAVSGCASTQFPGSSFGHQVEELRWTTVRLLEQPRWHQELWHDIRILADPEPGELASTFEMLGW